MIANKYANKIGQITEDDRIHLLSIIDYLGAIGVRVERQVLDVVNNPPDNKNPMQ